MNGFLGFTGVSNLPWDVLCNNAKFGRNIYNEMYKEETNKQTHALLCGYKRGTADETRFPLPAHESVPVSLLLQHTLPVSRVLHISLFPPVAAYFYFFALLVFSTLCKIPTIRSYVLRIMTMRLSGELIYFFCNSPHTVHHTCMEAGHSSKMKISAHAQNILGRCNNEIQDIFNKVFKGNCSCSK
jgi:hypothetical protein